MQLLQPRGDEGGGGGARRDTEGGAERVVPEGDASGREDEVDDCEGGQRRDAKERSDEDDAPGIAKQGAVDGLPRRFFGDQLEDPIARDATTDRVGDE